MKKMTSLLLILAVLVSTAVIFAVSYHSLEETHYLKSFYPDQFTVEEAFYASAVELIKILIISYPFLVVTALSAYFFSCIRKRDSRQEKP